MSFKHLLTVVIMFAGLCVPVRAAGDSAAATEGRTLRLSLRECLDIALQDNPTVHVADMEVTRTDYSKRETLAALFPTIDFTGSYQRSIELQTIRMNMGGESQSIKMGSDNSWNFGFSASMPLVSAQLWKSIKISDTQILASLESARSSRRNLVSQVRQAYYSLMLALASQRVIKQNYEVALFNAELFEKKFQAGTASEYDVLRSSVQVKNVEPELLQADIAIRQCKLQLLVLMGIDSRVDIEPTVTLDDMRADMIVKTSAVDRSLTDNSSLRSLDLQARMAAQNVALRKLAWVPTLAATFNISWMSLSNGNALRNQQFNPYSNVGVALQIPIFAGGSRYYALRQAQVQTKQLALQRENLINTLNMQVELALDNFDHQARQIDTSAEGMRQAAKAYDIMQKSFEIGAATYLDLRDSELANTTAQLVYYQAIHTYLISTAELDLLLGKE
ncbi:MAG: TolC family protein [Muribaculaceae bacterium]|nr:TolC family protein [Muribaculaceae bacterium]